MKLRRNKPSISKLVAQLEYIEQQLQRIEHDIKYLASPTDMKSLARMRYILPQLVDYTDMLNEKLWERIWKWQNSPYSKVELWRNNILQFVGWWFGVSLVVLQILLSLFWSLFPELWQLLVAGVTIGCFLVILLLIMEDK